MASDARAVLGMANLIRFLCLVENEGEYVALCSVLVLMFLILFLRGFLSCCGKLSLSVMRKVFRFLLVLYFYVLKNLYNLIVDCLSFVKVFECLVEYK